jgi:hypothetical protein
LADRSLVLQLGPALASIVTTRKFLLLLMYTALFISLLLPSKANEMSSDLGEQVKVWEPAMALHMRILFAPVIQVVDGLDFLNSVEFRDRGELWNQMFWQMAYWLPMTLAGWLMLLYPLVHRVTSLRARRYLHLIALVIAVTGTGLLVHHLLRWATLYEGYFHMGIGGYFVMGAFFSLCALMVFDAIETSSVKQ